MRLLTFQIDGHRLAVPSEAVASVGRPYTKEKVHPLDVRRKLGGQSRQESGLPVITCRIKKMLVEFSVDRVLNLGEYPDAILKPWPLALKHNRLFGGVADLEAGLHLILDLQALSSETGRSKR